MTRARRSSAPWLGLSLLLCTAVEAAPRTPCDVFDLPAPVQALKQRIKTRSRSAFKPIARDAAALTESGPPAARACAHYIAGAAWFFLSAGRTDRARHAAQATQHLVAAQILAPSLMKGRQPQARLRTAWQRLGTAWLPRGRPVDMIVPAGAGTLHLRPPPGVESPLRITLPLGPKPRTVQLRPGRWQVELQTDCGPSAAVRDLGAGPIAIPPAAPCAVALQPHDAAGPVTAFRVVDAAGKPVKRIDARVGPVTVLARGYRPTAVRLPAAGGPLPVRLTRCPVELVAHVRPPDAVVDGGGPQPWGKAVLTARRPGYADLRQVVQIPRPAACKGARHAVDLSLRRPVSVVAVDADGEPVVLSRLWINEAIADATSLSLPMGLYRYQAEHPALGTVSGAFTVRTCAAAVCDPATLRVAFERSRPGGSSHTGAWILMGASGLAFAVGAVSGSAAIGTQDEIDAYTTRKDEGFPISTLVARRNDEAKAADRAFLLGGGLLVGGLIWYLAGD